MSGCARIHIACGRFFFKYRNNLFPVVFLLAMLFLRPAIIFGDPRLDRLLTSLGPLVALAGEMVRLATIGFDYIDRGGKNKQVAASRLVSGGVYSICRNPMYVGNLLIATGLVMVAGSPMVYLLVIPFFLFVYLAITSNEESFLRERFGREYEEYCARVGRFVPSFKGVSASAFTGMRYDWKRSIRQDLSTILTVSMSLIFLPVWRVYFLWGHRAAFSILPGRLCAAVAVGGCYGILVYFKKQKKLFY